MLHVHRSTAPKKNTTSHLVSERVPFDKNLVHCLYNLMQKCRQHRTLTPECVHEQLEMVFDINVIEDQFEKLSDSVLGQCVQQVHVESEANTLRTVTCNYVYGSRVAADRVQPGTSIPTVSYNTLENRIKLHDLLQIKSKVKKQLIQHLSGIHDELLKVGDITDVRNTSASKQNTLNNYYEHLDYQNEMKKRAMNAGLCYRLMEQMWDRAPPLFSLPSCISDCKGQSQSTLLRTLQDATSKFTFALNKHGNKQKESAVLAEMANCWRINTDNSLSPTDCESCIEVEGENVPVSGVVILTDNLKVKLQNHIFARKTRLRNSIVVCDVTPDDFHPQKAFITDGKIKMDATNLFVKTEKQATVGETTKKVEFIKMGSELFAIHVIDPYYQGEETSAKSRFKEHVNADFMMPLGVKFTGHCSDELFGGRNNGNADVHSEHVVPTRVYFNNASGVTRSIGVDAVMPFVTGMLRELNRFKPAVDAAVQRLSKLFRLQQITKGRERDVIDEQYVRTFRRLDETFPMHYHLPIGEDEDEDDDEISTANHGKFFERVYQKPLWIMTGGLTYDVVLTNVLALWADFGYTNAIREEKLARHSILQPLVGKEEQARRLMVHGETYVRKHNPGLYPWIVNYGRQLKNILVNKMGYPGDIVNYVEFVLCLLNSEQLYRQVFVGGRYHPGLGFVLNRSETIETESMLLSRCQGYKLFYSQTSTVAINDCQSPDYNLVTSMQTGHMPSSLAHPCVRYPHCIVTKQGSMETEMIDFDVVFDTKKPVPRYDEQKWIPIFAPCSMSEVMFEDTFNPFGRSNIPFEKDSTDYLNPDLVADPLSGVPGYNATSLGLINLNFVCYSKLFTNPAGFSLKKHVVPNGYINFWFGEFQRNASRCNNRIMMCNLQENVVESGELTLHYDDLSQVTGGSTCKFCYSHPHMLKAVMSQRDNRAIPGRNVYREHNNFLLHGSKLMENLDRGASVNDQYALA
jgi:hypothetical protein